jgi:hypothetical protein
MKLAHAIFKQKKNAFSFASKQNNLCMLNLSVCHIKLVQMNCNRLCLPPLGMTLLLIWWWSSCWPFYYIWHIKQGRQFFQKSYPHRQYDSIKRVVFSLMLLIIIQSTLNPKKVIFLINYPSNNKQMMNIYAIFVF